MGATPFPATNTGFGPPPLQTPMTSANSQDGSQFGIPYQMRDADGPPNSGLDVAWMAWFNGLYGKVNGAFQVGTRANRKTLDPTTMPNSTYYETDTGLIYAAIAWTAIVTAATNATPVVYTAINQFVNGDVVNVSGILGNLGANDSVTVAAVSTLEFTGTGSHGTGAYTSGGIAVGPVRWTYLSGTYLIQQSGIAAFAATLVQADRGLLIDVFDYLHILRWTGSAFGFYLNDSSGYIVDAIAAPQGGLWQACDGSTGITVLKSDGTLLTVTVPNWNGTDSMEISDGTTAAGAGAIATVPTWQAGAQTDLEVTNHTHPITDGTTSINSAAVGTPVTVVTSVTNPTGVQSVHHSHTLSNLNAKMNPPSQANGGLPPRVAFQKYLRR